MRVKHIFGGHVYVISSYGVARNPIFKDQQDLRNFAQNMKEYLSDICEIHAFNHQINQFHYLIKVKERPLLEDFFSRKTKDKKGGKNIAHDIYDTKSESAPDSYLIFSQEVSNSLNSYVKKFNFRHKRHGGLFAARYRKYLVETEEEMYEWIDRINNMEKLVFFEDEWQVEETLENVDVECLCSYRDSEAMVDEEGEVKRSFPQLVNGILNDLRGCFNILPPSYLFAPNFLKKKQDYINFYGCDPPW